MPKKRYSVEQIINHLREADVLLAQGQTVGEICRRIGVSEQSYYRPSQRSVASPAGQGDVVNTAA